MQLRGGFGAALTSATGAIRDARSARQERKEVADRERESSRAARRLEQETRDRQRDEARREKHEARMGRLAERKRLAGAAARSALGWTASVWLEAALWVCLGGSLAVAYTVSYSSLGTVLGAFGYGSWERWAAPLAIDLPLTASVVGQLLAARWGSPFHVKATLLLLSLATAPLTLAGNALHGAVDKWGHFTYDTTGALAGGHVDLMHLVAFSIPGACVILVSLVASLMLTEREKLGRRTLATETETVPEPDAPGGALPEHETRALPVPARADDTAPSTGTDQEPVTERNPLPPRLPARVQVRRLLKRHGADLDPATVAARTGVSKRHAARLLREERQPDTNPHPKEV